MIPTSEPWLVLMLALSLFKLCYCCSFSFWNVLLVAILGTAVLVKGTAVSKPLVMCREVWGNRRCPLVLWLELSLVSEPVLLAIHFPNVSWSFLPLCWHRMAGCSGAGYSPPQSCCLWWCSSSLDLDEPFPLRAIPLRPVFWHF